MTVEDPGVEPRFWSITTSPDGLLVAGALDNRPWFVAYGPENQVRWRQLLELEETYIVHRLAVDPTGTYALAKTNQFAMGSNHLLLLSLGSEGDVEWARVFDPNYDDYATGPGDLNDVGVLDPDGGMQWARYDS